MFYVVETSLWVGGEDMYVSCARETFDHVFFRRFHSILHESLVRIWGEQISSLFLSITA